MDYPSYESCECTVVEARIPVADTGVDLTPSPCPAPGQLRGCAWRERVDYSGPVALLPVPECAGAGDAGACALLCGEAARVARFELLRRWRRQPCRDWSVRMYPAWSREFLAREERAYDRWVQLREAPVADRS